MLFGGSLPVIRRKFEPGEVLWPPVDVEGEFEAHVRRQSHEIVFIVRGVDAANDAIGAKSQALDLIATLDDVACRQEFGHLEEADDVKDDDSPPVNIQIERDLQYEAILCADLLVEITGGNPDSM